MDMNLNINPKQSKEMKKNVIFILKILVIILVFCWIAVIFVDYMKARNNETPIFCLQEETKVYSDGTTYMCLGLGYKIYKYERSFKAIEFGPFFIKERTSIK